MKLHVVLLKVQLFFLSFSRMLIKIAELKPRRFKFFKKNCYFPFICLKSINIFSHNKVPLKQIFKKPHSFGKSEERFLSTHLLTTPPPCCGSMREVGVWKEQPLSSQSGRVGLGKSVPLAERQKKYKICLPRLPLSEIMHSFKHVLKHLPQWLTESLKVLVWGGVCDTFSPAAEI